MFAPAISLGAMVFVDLSPSLDWGNVSAEAMAPFFFLGLGWMTSSPITATLALILNRWVGERWVKWANIGLLLFWVGGAPIILSRTYL